MERVYERAYAKINLSLDVVGKREDGYHLLEMIMQTVNLYDEVLIAKEEEGISFFCDKEFLNSDNNLVYRAAELFMKRYGIESGVSIRLNKHIPVGAGLAGGSTDAAAVLRGLSRLFKVLPTPQEYKQMCVELGADVYYCLKGGTALAEGIGEKLTFLEPLKDIPVVLVKPKFGVSTPKAYKALKWDEVKRHPDTVKMIEAIRDKDVRQIAENMVNVLEEPVLKMYPAIKGIKKRLDSLGAAGTLMSGSGSCVFGIFENVSKRNRAYFNLLHTNKNRYDFLSRQMICKGDY